jgi:hypothetical protein
LEIADEGKQIELMKELMELVTKALAARGRQLDEATWNKVLNPIFKGKERKMVKTIFDEKYDAGIADGETKAGRELVLRVLRKKFKKVPKDIEAKVLSKNDPIALASLAEHVIDSSTLEEFAKDL